MARGIDATDKGAMDAHGRRLEFSARALRLLPEGEQEVVRKRFWKRGAQSSVNFPLPTHRRGRKNFPVRNRLVAGMRSAWWCRGARSTAGSLITRGVGVHDIQCEETVLESAREVTQPVKFRAENKELLIKQGQAGDLRGGVVGRAAKLDQCSDGTQGGKHRRLRKRESTGGGVAQSFGEKESMI